MIRLEETETELLLFVPYEDRDRAKRVEGRRWDPDRKCWVYPKSTRVYDALVGEFGDEIAKLAISRAAMSATVRPGATMSIAAPVPSVTAPPNSHIDALTAEIARSSRDVGRLTAELEAAREEARQLSAERDQLRKQAASANSRQPAAPLDAVVVFNHHLRSLAKQTAGSSSEFRLFVENLKTSTAVPQEIGMFLERQLRSRMAAFERIPLVDVIRQAEDSDILTTDGAHLAHLIRRQRNLLVHDGAARTTHEMRSVLALSAAALLWAEME